MVQKTNPEILSMSMIDQVLVELEKLKKDYALDGGESFKHFFCPILLKDEDKEVCMGHIINKSIPNSCRKMIPQRKDIDNFYGSLFETYFITAVKAKVPSAVEVLLDPDLSREIPVEVSVAGEKVQHYEYRGDKAPSHSIIQLRDGDEKVADLVLKISEKVLQASGNKIQIAINRNFVPEATASLLKAAHLTMFSTLGYRYVFSPAGNTLAEILRAFYEKNAKKSRQEKTDAAREYFSQKAGMILPLKEFDEQLIKGSLEDRRFLICIGSSGKPFALGVLVRTDDLMHIVFLPPDNADNMGVYLEFVKNMYKKTFRYHLVDFIPDSDGKSARWNAYKNEFIFDPAMYNA